MKRIAARRVVLPFVVVACAVYLPKALWPHAAMYVDVLSPLRLRILGAAAELACLGLGAIFCLRSAARFERENPARWPWLAIGGWLALWALGQAVLMYLAFVRQVLPPVPSAADGLFLLGYGLLFTGQVRFIFVYRASGFPVGSGRQHLLIAGAAVVVLGALACALLAPMVRSEAPFAERFINIAYPVMDLAALVPTLVMIRIALAFRPGKVWTVWAALLAGFALIAAGDFVAAFLWTSEQVSGNPWIHLSYLLGYFFAACGAKLQEELLTE